MFREENEDANGTGSGLTKYIGDLYCGWVNLIKKPCRIQ
jgi:hypothetical protein